MAVSEGNFDLEAARRFHEVTKHSYTSVRAGDHYLDWDNEPFKFKIYPQAPEIALPRELSLSRVPTLTALERGSAPAAPSGTLDMERLARILFCTAGLTRTRRVGDRDYHFRAAPSAGALYPIEVYLATGSIDGVAAGLHHFSPADLKLRMLREGDWRVAISRACAENAGVASATCVLLLSAIFWRSAWKYRARCYRYCFWDTGTILANLTAAAAAEAIDAKIVSAFVDSEIEQLLGIDGDREGAVCLVALNDHGSTAVPTQTSGATAPARPAPLTLDSVPLSNGEQRYDELVRLHCASKLRSRAETEQLFLTGLEATSDQSEEAHQPPSTGSSRTLQLSPAGVGTALGIGETILRRGSTRIFARKPIHSDALAAVLCAAGRHPRIDFPPLTDTYLIVNAVEGVEPGAYLHRRQSAELELLRAGELRAQAGYLCLEQSLGADCSALICFMTDLERVIRARGNRGYRETHLEAGILAGNAYLAAYALGLGASGLTFYDDDTSDFFTGHAKQKSPLLMVAVGIPATARTS